MATQRDIAKVLGFSTATISRALRNRGDHDVHTRARILESAATLGYRLPQRQQAANPKVPASAPIGVSLCAPPNALPHVALRLLHGISDAARAAGRLLQLDYIDSDQGATAGSADAVRPVPSVAGLEGMIFYGDVPSATLAQLDERCPGVRIALRDPGIALDGIGQDDLAASSELIAHLVACGHRRIGFIGDGVPSSFACARAAACIQALLQHGQAVGPPLLVNLGLPAVSEDVGVAQVVAAIDQGTTAWICIHDALGYQLLRALRSRGHAVPAAVAIVGYDFLPTPDDCPPLTTIDWPLEAMGAEAVKRLLQRLACPDEPLRQVVLPGRLVIRSSTRAGP